MSDTKFIIILDGGIITDVVAPEGSDLVGIEFAVVDYDIQGMEDEDTELVKNIDGTSHQAVVIYDNVCQTAITLEDQS